MVWIQVFLQVSLQFILIVSLPHTHLNQITTKSPSLYQSFPSEVLKFTQSEEYIIQQE